MKAIFIADAHLKGLNDPNQKHLCSFLETLNDINKLFILGDLFEFWTGYNQLLDYQYAPILTHLKRLKEMGTEIIYIEGNHDFSVGAFFTDILKATVYPDSADIDLNGKRFFLTHGDIIKQSAGYKIWRKFLRSHIFSMINKSMPPSFIWKVAMFLSKKSRRNSESGISISKLQREFAIDKIDKGFDIVILAHSHIPKYSVEFINGKKGIYANPGDWGREFSYLSYEDGEIRLNSPK